MIVLVAMLLQAPAISSLASDVKTPAAPSVITNPDWARMVTGKEIAKYYPKAALVEDLAGRAVLNCNVSVAGTLEQCGVTNVDPEGVGFGEAALAMRVAFRMRPLTRDGVPVAGGIVRIPLNFRKPVDLRAASITTRNADIEGEVVELDCRYKSFHLDNCFPRGASSPKAAEVAIRLAADVTLPPMPRAQGRILLPVIFASSAGAPVQPDLVTTPKWLQVPSRVDVYRAYPETARRDRRVGSVVAECTVTAEGTLAQCSTVSEAPLGMGFGQGGVKLMPEFKMAPLDSFGIKVEGRKIRIPIRFSPAAPSKRGTG